jgi:hypothetical protein
MRDLIDEIIAPDGASGNPFHSFHGGSPEATTSRMMPVVQFQSI